MKTQFIKNAQEAFLRDTVNHFNSMNRGTGVNMCIYSPREPVHCGCAIGRHIPNKKLCSEFDENEAGTVDSEYIFPQLPGQLQALGIAFLCSMQGLHDNEENWGADGLSSRGIHRVGRICANYNLDWVHFV